RASTTRATPCRSSSASSRTTTCATCSATSSTRPTCRSFLPSNSPEAREHVPLACHQIAEPRAALHRDAARGFFAGLGTLGLRPDAGEQAIERRQDAAELLRARAGVALRQIARVELVRLPDTLIDEAAERLRQRFGADVGGAERAGEALRAV